MSRPTPSGALKAPDIGHGMRIERRKVHNAGEEPFGREEGQCTGDEIASTDHKYDCSNQHTH